MYYIIILDITIIDFYLSILKCSGVNLMKICPLPAVDHQEVGAYQGLKPKRGRSAQLHFRGRERSSQEGMMVVLDRSFNRWLGKDHAACYGELHVWPVGM